MTHQWPGLWRVNVKSRFSESRQAAIEFILTKSICASGWYSANIPDKTTKEEYLSLGNSIWKDDRNWKKNSNYFCSRMNKGDLVWIRDLGGNYYLGEITSDFIYRSTQEYKRYDFHMIRSCNWIKVGNESEIPGAVKRSFIVSNVTAPILDEFAIKYSDYLNHKLNNKKWLPVESKKKLEIIDALDPDSLEDLVALHLYIKGWFIIPSSCKKSTPYTEFILKNNKGLTAFVQVKSGKASFDITDKNPVCDCFFVFESTHTDATLPSPYIRISREDLTATYYQHKALLPSWKFSYFEDICS